MDFILIQLIGIVGLILISISFQRDKRSFTLVFQFLASLAFIAHFSLLGAFTGAAMNVGSAARASVFYFRESRPWVNHKIVMYAFIALFWVGGFLTWDSYASMLPVISMTLECIALWSTDTALVRWLFLSARPTWIAYDIIVGSYAGLLTEAFIITSVLVAIMRFKRLKKSIGGHPHHVVGKI